MISTSRSSVREVDPVVEAAPLERVVELARPVRGDHDGGGVVGGDRAELGHRDREVGEHLEQERLELVVGTVELVDEQHGAGAAARIARSSGRSSRKSGPYSSLTRSRGSSSPAWSARA